MWSGNFLSRKPEWFKSLTLRQFTPSAFERLFFPPAAGTTGARCAPKARPPRIRHAPRGEKEMFWSWIRKFDKQSSNKLKIYNQSFSVRQLADGM